MSEDSLISKQLDMGDGSQVDLVDGFGIPIANIARDMLVVAGEGGEIGRVNSLNVLENFEQVGIVLDDKEGIASALDSLRTEFGIEDIVF
jgi:hypothetical protein